MPSSITFIATSTSSHKRQRSSYTITDSRHQLCRGARVGPVQPPFASSIFDFPSSFVSRSPASCAIVMPSVARLPTLPSVPFGQRVWPCRVVDWPGSVVLTPHSSLLVHFRCSFSSFVCPDSRCWPASLADHFACHRLGSLSRPATSSSVSRERNFVLICRAVRFRIRSVVERS